MMSLSRAASSRGISHFPKDDIADVLLQAADWYHVDRLVKGALKQSLDGDKIEQVAFVCHFDQDIDVRLWRCLAARHRAEDSNAGNVTLRELRLELAKFSEDFREGDHLRKGTAASGWKEAEVAGRVELDLHTNPGHPNQPRSNPPRSGSLTMLASSTHCVGGLAKDHRANVVRHFLVAFVADGQLKVRLNW